MCRVILICIIKMIIPRDYQIEANDATFNYFYNGNIGNPLVCLPTGTGKGFVIADFQKQTLMNWPDQRILMMTHSKMLVEQNAEKLLQHWPSAPVGIFSAGLRQYERALPLIHANVLSVANELARNPKAFGRIDVIQVDEAHMISPEEESAFQFVFRALKEINPLLIIIGYTATPYRMKGGLIVGAGTFTETVYDLTDIGGFRRLINNGYLSPVITANTESRLNVSNLKTQAGDYSRKSMSEEIERIRYEACEEMIELGADRNCWMVFTSGIEDTDNTAETLRGLGIEAYSVHSKKTSKQNDSIIEAFKAGDIQAIVGADMLTTGFDHAPVDFIGNLRKTKSPAVWVQIVGRGTRPSEETGKENCLVADFAKNIEDIGPVDQPRIPGRKKKSGGDMPVRICENCNTYSHASAKDCEVCGFEFSFEIKISSNASSGVVMKSVEPPKVEIEQFDVTHVTYNRHERRGSEGELLSPPSIKVSYWTPSGKIFNEWIHLESPKLRKLHSKWWFERMQQLAPETTTDALNYVSMLSRPKQIVVDTAKKYPKVKGYIW